MTDVSEIIWHPTTASIAISLLAISACVVVNILCIGRSSRRAAVLLLEMLRTTIVVAVCLLLNQPEWITKSSPSTQPSVVIINDNSGSMETPDIDRISVDSKILLNDSGSSRLTRRELAESITRLPVLNSLESRFRVHREDLDSNSENASHPKATNISKMVDRVLQEYRDLSAIIMISDGDWNAGNPPEEVARQLSDADIRFVGVDIGSKRRLADVELTTVDLPTFGIADKKIRIPIAFESTLPREITAVLRVTLSNGEIISRDVRIAPMSKSSEVIEWMPKSPGDYTFKFDLSVHPDEQIVTNNSLEASIKIREERLRVLIVESQPRWEYRYLRNALSRDPGVDVSCLLLHPELSKVGGGNRDYISHFPNTKELLSEYDVVILGDVGLKTGQLTTAECELIAGLVGKQASGLIFIPGMLGNQTTLVESPLRDLLPIQFDLSRPEGWGSRNEQHIELTEVGRKSLLTRLTDSAEDNQLLWKELPGFHWHAAINRAKAGTEVLAVHQANDGSRGRLPLLITQSYGAGKVLLIGTDSAWRWRRGVEDKYHYRFWSQVVRWMAYQRNMATSDGVRLYFSPEQPQIGQRVFVTANIQSATGEPLSHAEVTVKSIAPSGQVESVALQNEPGEWGVFSGQFTPSEAGTHKLNLSAKDTGKSLETELMVSGDTAEKIGRPARPEVLQEIADGTRGLHVSPDRIAEIPSFLASIPKRELEIDRVAIWSNPWVAGTLIVLSTIIWVGRKMIGLL